jgi:putative NADH-flavin reductase
MRIIIFGATGKTGLCFVKQALAHAHSVTAFLRDPVKLAVDHPELHKVVGDIQDRASVDKAFAEPFDAAISALGIYHREPRTELSSGTKNVLDALLAHGVRRFGVVSSLGAGDSKGQGNFLARNLQRILLSHVLEDKGRQEELIRKSGLQWTIVRPPQLIDDPRIRTDLCEWQGSVPKDVKLTWKVSRASVAAFVLSAIENGSHINQVVNISEPK